jgi:hypothetical protein
VGRTAGRRMLAPAAGSSLAVEVCELAPTAGAVWVPSITASQNQLQVPVTGLPGTPLPQDEMSRLVYTVRYTRRAAYALRGVVTVSHRALDGRSDSTGAMQLQPTVMLRSGGREQAVPASDVRCAAGGTLYPGGSMRCDFTARLFSYDEPPAPGTVRATVRAPYSPAHVTSEEVAYSFADGATPPPGARLGTGWLLDSLLSGGSDNVATGAAAATKPTARVNNYFERHDDVLLPVGIAGVQPPPDTLVSESASFTYTALFADVARDKCGKPWKVRER